MPFIDNGRNELDLDSGVYHRLTGSTAAAMALRWSQARRESDVVICYIFKVNVVILHRYPVRAEKRFNASLPTLQPSGVYLPLRKLSATMDFPQAIPVTDIATMINARLVGDHQLVLTGINEIHKVRSGDITFVDHPKYFNTSLSSAASAIIVPTEMDCPDGKVLLVAEKPFLAYEAIVNSFRPIRPLTTHQPDDQVIHPDVMIEPGAVIGQHVHIGAGSIIQSGAVIRPYTYIGKRVIIQSAAVIGGQAFYFKKWPEGYQAWTGCGRVIIEDDVWIGAGTTIAQGVSGDTVIGAGTKIDCQVMIGHGVVIGKNCLITAQVGIAGKTVIGDGCVLYGQVGITQNLNIGNRVTILAQSGVMHDLEEGKTYFGSPAEEARDKYREMTQLKWMARQKPKAPEAD